jgi:hypothetical protein
MRSGAIERIEDRSAGGAWHLSKRQASSLAPRGPGPRVAGGARKHEAVDDERVLSRREEFGEADLTLAAGRELEPVVVRERPSWGQRAPFCGDALARPAQLDLRLEQPIALLAVLAGLAGKADVRVYRQRG